MKAEDTLLTIPQGTEPQTTLCRHCAYMAAQADYSFKVGIKEVVEWINGNVGLGAKTIDELNNGYCFVPIRADKWKAQLKIWGL